MRIGLVLLHCIAFFLLFCTTSSQQPQPPPNHPKRQWIPQTTFPPIVREEFPSAPFDDVLRLRMFSVIEYPESFLARLPVIGDYLLFLPFPDSKQFNYCEMAQQVADSLQITSCSSFFCENEVAGQMLSSKNNTERIAYAKIFNYCLYCSVRDSSNVTQVREFLAFQDRVTNNIQTCPYAFQKFDVKHCGDRGFPMLSNETIVMEDYNKNKPFLCFCSDSDAYGAYCDAYTSTLNFSNYYVKNWIFVAIAAVYLLVLVFLIGLPSMRACCLNLRSRKRKRKLTFRYSLAIVCDLRHQCIVFLTISVILFIITQVFAVLEVTATLSLNSLIADSSNFRVMSSVCVGLAYAALLVLWATYYSIAQTLRKRLTWQAKLLMLLLYLGLLVVIFLMVLLRVLGLPDTIIFAVVAGCCIAYIVVFPMGFTVYGLALCCIIKRGGGSVSFADFKIARFMLLSNLNYLVTFILYLVVAIGYTVGWDYVGYALGSYRNVFLDIPNLIVTLTVIYMLFFPKQIMDMYAPVLPDFIRKKLMPKEQPQTQSKSPKTPKSPDNNSNAESFVSVSTTTDKEAISPVLANENDQQQSPNSSSTVASSSQPFPN